MTDGKPARTAARRTRSIVLVVGFGCVALVLAQTALATVHHLLEGPDPTLQMSTSPSPDGWPQHGQAAIALGNGRPAASSHQQPVPIASLAKVMTAYLTLERYPLTGSQDGFTTTVTESRHRPRPGTPLRTSRS